MSPSAPLLQPVAVGTPVGAWTAGAWQVTRTAHAPNLELRAHRHSHANLVCVLRGRFIETIGRTSHDCSRASVLVKPAGETHSNVYGARGAECVIVEPLVAAGGALGGLATIFDSVRHLREPAISLTAAELAAEATRPDEASPLVVESLVLELIARAARTVARESRAKPLVDRVRELLHASFRENITLARIASEVGRHPAHVVRTFRNAQHCTIGTYVRRLRIEWAANELLTSNESISAIAASAGFYDHPHFCRLFKAHFGITPAELRTRRR